MRVPTLASLLPLAVFVAPAPTARADAAVDAGRWSVGTSAWMLANALPDSPQFAYVEADRTVGARDALALSALTWRYRAPIGIPYTSASFGADDQRYPGYVRSLGAGLGWRHRLYRGLTASLWSFHLLQLYGEEQRPRKTGYQLFLQARLGWRLHVQNPGFWIEPAIAFNAWPIEVGRPESFRARDDRWPSYFLFEPWLNVGFSW